MLNQFKPSLRVFLKNKIFTGINILGLSIGISVALVIYLIVRYDFSFDRYEPDGNRIYRLVTVEQNFSNSGVPVPMLRQTGGITGIDASDPKHSRR